MSWAAEGDVRDGFCWACRSHFCPHADPFLYTDRKLKIEGNAFSRATNTLVLDRNHEQGIARGSNGQAFAAEALGAKVMRGERAPYDLLAVDGTRIDVKTTKPGMPLMIPVKHAYKLNTSRCDAFLLVWDRPEPKMVGKIGVQEFAERHHRDGAFPIPTMHMSPFELEPIPATWFAAGKESV